MFYNQKATAHFHTGVGLVEAVNTTFLSDHPELVVKHLLAGKN